MVSILAGILTPAVIAMTDVQLPLIFLLEPLQEL
jgi:hypothetical protein